MSIGCIPKGHKRAKANRHLRLRRSHMHGRRTDNLQIIYENLLWEEDANCGDLSPTMRGTRVFFRTYTGPGLYSIPNVGLVDTLSHEDIRELSNIENAHCYESTSGSDSEELKPEDNMVITGSCAATVHRIPFAAAMDMGGGSYAI